MFYRAGDWDDLQVDLHVSLHVGFETQFAGIGSSLLRVQRDKEQLPQSGFSSANFAIKRCGFNHLLFLIELAKTQTLRLDPSLRLSLKRCIKVHGVGCPGSKVKVK